MSQALSSSACLHTKRYTSIIHQLQSNANGAHFQRMATTWPWADLPLWQWSKEQVWECFWLSEVALLVSPSSILPLPGYKWLNWEVIDAGCQVALEKCHRNASCQWFEWLWRPCCRLSQRPHPNRCPNVPASLNSTTLFLPSKTCQSGTQ